MLAHWQIRSALLALSVLTYVFTCTAAAEVSADNTNRSSGLPPYRSTVSEVRVTFFATDETNRPLEDLTKSDFALVDSELVVRSFPSLARSEEISLAVVALVDLSESVAPRLRVAMSDVRQLVAPEQSIPDDNIAVPSFGGTPEGSFGCLRPPILCLIDCGASNSVSKLKTAKSGGATPLFDALIFAADFTSHHRRAGARPVVVLFSDDNDTISVHSAREALEGVLDPGTLIYSIDGGTSDMGISENPSAGSMFLRPVSKATGRRYFSFSPRLSQQGGAAIVLNAVLEDLRASYVATYDLPSHTAGFHPLRLLPNHNLNPTFLTSNKTDRMFYGRRHHIGAITMRALLFPILTLALSLSSSAKLAANKPELHIFTQVKTERVVIGSVADISVRYEDRKPITVIHVLEFSTDLFPREPELLQVRLYGDQGGRLEPALHTNITLVYNLASHTRLTGCLNLISSEPWQDSSKWQTVNFTSNKVKRSMQLEKSILDIINGTVAN